MSFFFLIRSIPTCFLPLPFAVPLLPTVISAFFIFPVSNFTLVGHDLDGNLVISKTQWPTYVSQENWVMSVVIIPKFQCHKPTKIFISSIWLLSTKKESFSCNLSDKAATTQYLIFCHVIEETINMGNHTLVLRMSICK